jgi:P pilus assembly chaperone PapD
LNKFLSALLLSGCALTAQAGPSINIGTFYDYLEGDKSTFLKRVYNVGDSTAFVRVNIFEITFDSAGQALETPLHSDAQDAAQRKGLIASPARLIIPSKGMQATRLLYMGARDEERYYRVRYTPVVPEKEDQFAVSEADREAYAESMSAGVNVMAGYGAVFFVRPKETRFDTRIDDHAVHYQVENKGNSTIELDDFKDCTDASKSDCLPTRKHILRPGMTFGFEKQEGRLYYFNLIEGGRITPKEVR